MPRRIQIPRADIEAAIRRKRYWANPVAWNRDVLKGHVWSKQRDIWESVRDNRYTACRAGHGGGKSDIAARIALWFLDTSKVGDAFVVSTATTFKQVEKILWRYIRRFHKAAKLSGYTNKTELYLTNAEGDDEIVAFGMKPQDIDPDAFQGIHAQRVLILVDEAGGVHKNILDAAGSLMTNEDCRMLLIGNPTDPTAEFAELCRRGDNLNIVGLSDQGYNVIEMSVFDTPNFTGEKVPIRLSKALVSKVWVEEKTKKYGVGTPMYEARVKGRFPKVASGKLIPVAWIQAAQSRVVEPGEPRILSIDVGRGTNKSTTGLRTGYRFRVVEEHQVPSVTFTGRRATELKLLHRASHVHIDEVGVGAGTVDRAHEIAGPDADTTPNESTDALTGILGVNVGGKAHDPSNFGNLRAEGFWTLRQLFEDGLLDIDPDDDVLAAQLSSIDYRVRGGKIWIKSKEEMERDGLESPDRADCMMLGYVKPTNLLEVPLTWGD